MSDEIDIKVLWSVCRNDDERRAVVDEVYGRTVVSEGGHWRIIGVNP